MKFDTLNQPYPFTNNPKRDFTSSLLFGLFVFLFLFVFQPFGLSNYQAKYKTLELAGYGLVTFTLLFGNYRFFALVFPNWFSKAKWTVGKNILFTIYIFFIIGFGNLLYSFLMGYITLSIKGFLFYQSWTILVGAFPITLSSFFIYNRRLKDAVKEANQLNEAIHPASNQVRKEIIIPSQNKSEDISLTIEQLLSIKSVENYVEVYSFSSGKLNKTVLRNTLKNIQASLNNFSSIEQCHRSYLVNLDQVKNFKGNAQGLSLNFEQEIDLEIPVARSYVQHIKDQLKHTK